MAAYIDLTHTFKEGMQTGQGSPVEFTQIGRQFVEGFKSTRVCFSTHTGTHIDSPAHMLGEDEQIEPLVHQMPLDTLIGPAKVIRLTKNKGEVVSREDLIGSGVQLGKGDRLLVSLDWAKHFNSRQFFDLYPYFSLDAIQYIIDCGVVLLGMDTPSPDRNDLPYTDPERTINHKTLMRAGVLVVETLDNITAIPGDECEVIILPLKALNLDGFPVRAVAISK